MTAGVALFPVPEGGLPEYPVDRSVRLDSHAFFAWEFRRWLSSDLRWNGDHEAKSIWFELVNVAHDQTPVGTLPRDLARLCRMVQPPVDLRRFEALCRMPFGPLHGWVPCDCDGEVRMMHPKVTEVVVEALARKADNQARVEAAARDRRLKRLTIDVAELSKSLSEDGAAIAWIDRWLTERGVKRRTAQNLHDAVQACLAARGKGFGGR